VTTTGSKRILIVDDDAAVVGMLGAFFNEASEPYEIDTAANGAEALSAIGRQRPDVVLLDFTMPGMDGLSVLKLIRNLDSRIRVIMLTGGDCCADALRNGAFAYIPKPINVQYVEHLVGAALEPPRPLGLGHRR
jgi:two-component system response regulator (stage 0 sporulation protein F)